MLKIVSDIDDTLMSSGGSFPAGCDRTYPKRCIYPGFLALLSEMDIAHCLRVQVSGAHLLPRLEWALHSTHQYRSVLPHEKPLCASRIQCNIACKEPHSMTPSTMAGRLALCQPRSQNHSALRHLQAAEAEAAEAGSEVPDDASLAGGSDTGDVSGSESIASAALASGASWTRGGLRVSLRSGSFHLGRCRHSTVACVCSKPALRCLPILRLQCASDTRKAMCVVALLGGEALMLILSGSFRMCR